MSEIEFSTLADRVIFLIYGQGLSKTVKESKFKAVLYHVRKALLNRCKGVLSYRFTNTLRKPVLY